MPIQEQNIVFVESQVMDDVPEGGGAATGKAIEDGQMNNVFEDISDLDRAMGRFNLRKVFVAVRTINTDLYGGAKALVTELPEDDALGYTLFTTNDPFDNRAAASGRVEAYLFKSVPWHGWLYGNHIAGMKAITLIQRVGSVLPPSGRTLCLTVDEGLSTEIEQYVRVIEVTTMPATFNTGTAGEFEREQVTFTLSDPLLHDFPGFDTILSTDNYNFSGKTRIRDTTVADAQRYFGAQRVTETANIGDLTVRAQSMFTQLVPAARSEISLVNQPTAAGVQPVIQSGEPYQYSVGSITIGAGARVFTRGGVLPGTLSINRGGFVVTDNASGGLLYGSTVVGAINYGDGELVFNGSAPNTTGSATISYTPGALAPQQGQTIATQITIENRALNYVRLLLPIPAPGTVSVAFHAQGVWYVLTDAGADGILQSSDPAIGTGTVNYTTGTVAVTLGALPDVGGQIIFTWGTGIHYVRMDEAAPQNQILAPVEEPGNARVGFYLYGRPQESSVVITIPMPDAAPLVLAWEDDNPNGNPGFFSGNTRYGWMNGSNRIELTFPGPNYPADNTEISISYLRTTYKNTATQEVVEETSLDSKVLAPTQDPSTPDYIFNVNQKIDPGTLRIRPQWTTLQFSGAPTNFSFSLKDDGNGNVGLEWDTPSVFSTVVRFHGAVNSAEGGFKVIGAVDYATGQITIFRTIAVRVYIYSESNNQWNVIVPQASMNPMGSAPVSWGRTEQVISTIQNTETVMTPTTTERIIFPVAEVVEEDPIEFDGPIYTNGVLIPLTPRGTPVIPNSLVLEAFGHTYVDRNGILYADPSPTTGAGTIAGTYNYATGNANITYRSAAGEQTRHALLARYGDFTVSEVYFRAERSPLAPEGFTLSGTQSFGDTLTGMPDEYGVIDSPGIDGFVNYEFGTGYARFGLYVDPEPEILQIGHPTNGQVYNLQPGGYRVDLRDNNGTFWNSNLVWDRDAGTATFRLRQVGMIGYNPTAFPLFLHFYAFDPAFLDPNDTQGHLQRLRTGVVPESIRYSAVAFSYIPLPSNILGINAVRLPTDGRVPVFKPGDVAMVMHRLETAPTTPTQGTPVSLGRTRIGWVRVIDANGETVCGNYDLDRAAGTVTFTDLTGIATPVVIRHTVADLRLVTDVQINGALTLARPLTHNYPANESIVASCLLFGDRRARVSHAWDQVSWNGTWTDSLVGNEATASLDLIAHPIVVTNEGAETERWVLRWINSTNVELIGQNRGLVFTGPFTEDIAPINPRTRNPDGTGGVPYLTIPVAANGGGWSAGNVVRINTVGAIADMWIARAIQQSDEPMDDGADGCEIYAIGNIDRP